MVKLALFRAQFEHITDQVKQVCNVVCAVPVYGSYTEPDPHSELTDESAGGLTGGLMDKLEAVRAQDNAQKHADANDRLQNQNKSNLVYSAMDRADGGGDVLVANDQGGIMCSAMDHGEPGRAHDEGDNEPGLVYAAVDHFASANVQDGGQGKFYGQTQTFSGENTQRYKSAAHAVLATSLVHSSDEEEI